MDEFTASLIRAFAFWLPAGTLGPFLVSLRTHASFQQAIIEATLFALFGLLFYPTLLAMLLVRYVKPVPVEPIVGVSFVLATFSVIGLRRYWQSLQRPRR
ncbi:hypothetical protein [Thermorudis peleae]|jgi:hypothetical protein|uniref:hypothetical protein n=1 Tax=Thermorudis peleae TaxID=1382356 RepID=UPI000571215C|nr:hypothetical protein [Thermorudis peleae]MBX6753604.1 hypothetical protein [Thermorudis peleae]